MKKSSNHFVRNSLAMAVAMGISGTAMAAPGQPIVQWMEENFAIIEVDQAASAYKDLVTIKDGATVPVAWDMWSGAPGTSWQVLLNGEVVHQEAIADTPVQKGVVDLLVKTGGQYALTVKLCDDTGACSESAAKNIVVADTDGSHLDPLDMKVDPSNGNYTTPENTVVGTYFVEWGVYGRKFSVDEIPAQNLTHIIYGFVPICGPNESLGEIENGNSLAALNRACAGTADYEMVIHDPWAAVQMPQGDHIHSTPYKGTYGQMMALKQRYPDLKILPSVGGWTLSDPFYDFVDKSKRDIFVASAKKFLQTWKFFDGIDIDWEYPGGQGAHPTKGNPDLDGQAYADLMKELRAMLDELSAETGREYQLTSAVGVGYDKIEDVNYIDAVPHMDYIFAMTYDYYGGWNNVVGHQTALYCGSHMTADECNGTGLDDEGKPRKGPAYTSANGINLLLEKGVPANKLVVGAAMYARGWTGVTEASMTDPTNPMTGVGNGKVKGSWEAGVIDYKDVVRDYINNPSVQKFYDEAAEAPYAWNPATGDLITYDDKRSVMAKGQYVKDNGFAGLFSWEIDADNGDILNAMQESLQGNVVITPPPTDVPPTDVPPTDVPPTDVPPTDVPPTDVPPTDVPPTDVPPTDVPPTDVPPTDVPPTDVPPTDVPPTEPPTNATPWVAGSTKVANGDVVSFNGACFEAKNNPGVWESPVAGGNWFWTEVPCDGAVITPTDTPVVTDEPVIPTDEPTLPGSNWDAAAVYNGGDEVVVNGVTYQAKWWTQGDNPEQSGDWGVWKKL
ncbi:glycosyl hydrolase family 18 protein [Motilimonas pumila]|uniref:chitinase n=1 Tax=Motilimonas pumila TaxID=2303987 RepID=A0A418YF83_9GAMM|nr:glycosyl hydrolase family 18 protein [Motilimonas pumila]RJG47883.1 chitinase [Motilimonas pumila]